MTQSTRSTPAKRVEVCRVRDLHKLKEVLEDVNLMKSVYSRFLGGKVVSARLNMYEHPDGVEVEGVPGRYWVYVTLENGSGDVYDVALWKVLRYAHLSREVSERLGECLEMCR